MSAASSTSVVLRKELRALLPVWLAGAFAIGATAVLGSPRNVPLILFLYAVGPIVLGAQSIGHEYTYGTIGAFLAQPVDRRRMLLIKIGVLALTISVLLALWLVFPDRSWALQTAIWRPSAVLGVAAVCGLFVAPALTMLSRSPLPGIVFTTAAPMLLLLLGEILATAKYGANAGIEIDRLKLAVFWRGLLALCVVGAISTWRMFMRLEDLDGYGPQLRLPHWVRGRTLVRAEPIELDAVRRGHPIWLLVRKELRLQQLTFAVVGLSALALATIAVLRHSGGRAPRLPLAPLTLTYLTMLSMLIGALASAEERHFGTVEWQLLLPIAMWKQWMVKAGTAVGLAMLLAIGVTVTLSLLHLPDYDLRPPSGVWWREAAQTILLVTTGSLYVSTLCGSGVRALVMSIAGTLGASILIDRLSVLAWLFDRSFQPQPVLTRAVLSAWRARAMAMMHALDVLSLVTTGIFVALFLWFAYTNHRSVDRSIRRIWPQIAFLAVLVAGTVIARAAILVFYRAF
jgi:hypothetical protein